MGTRKTSNLVFEGKEAKPFPSDLIKKSPDMMILTRIKRHQEEEKPIEGNTYDSVPPLTPNLDHLYANTQVDI